MVLAVGGCGDGDQVKAIMAMGLVMGMFTLWFGWW